MRQLNQYMLTSLVNNEVDLFELSEKCYSESKNIRIKDPNRNKRPRKKTQYRGGRSHEEPFTLSLNKDLEPF